MLIALRDVPNYERHLLFCSRLSPRRRSRNGDRRRPKSMISERSTKSNAQTVDDLSVIPLAAGFDAAGTTVCVA